jgi:phage baseplate assembly protein W
LGADLGSLLFELDTDLNKRDIKTLVESTISNYEPRAIVNQVIVNIKPDYNSVDVLVKFNVVDFEQEVSVNVNIARIR